MRTFALITLELSALLVLAAVVYVLARRHDNRPVARRVSESASALRAVRAAADIFSTLSALSDGTRVSVCGSDRAPLATIVVGDNANRHALVGPLADFARHHEIADRLWSFDFKGHHVEISAQLVSGDGVYGVATIMCGNALVRFRTPKAHDTLIEAFSDALRLAQDKIVDGSEDVLHPVRTHTEVST